MRSAGAWIEGRDAAALAERLGRGEIVWRAFVDAGTAMRRCARFAEADRMLERGLGAFPDDPTLLYEHALCAHDGGRYPVAVERWEKALRFAAGLSPDRAAMCRCGLAANLRVLGQLDRARAVIGEARRLYPHDLVALSEAAQIAEVGAELDEALALWRTALATPDPPVEWVQGEIAVLVRLGRLDEAERALALGRSRFKQLPGLVGAEASSPSARGDWARAVESWTAYVAYFPNDKGGRDQLAAALEASRSPPRPAVQAPAPPAETSELLRLFESIGETREFAVVQRRCGIEPEGLLSWSTLTLDALVPALDQCFAGLGEPDNSRLVLPPGGGCVLRDRRWPLDIDATFHGGQAVAQRSERVEEASLLAEAGRRIVAARDRLLADLAAAEKIFVFRSDGLDGDRLELLHRALAAYGPVRLLNVQPAAPTAPTLLQGQAGEVIRIEKNRFVGFLERFAGSDAPAVADWIALCRKTISLA